MMKSGEREGLLAAKWRSKYCIGISLTKPTLRPVPGRGADSGTKRNGLSEADLDVPAKLFEEGLQRREEAEALPGRQVVAEHDLLQLGVAERVQVEVPRQVAA